MRKTILLAAGLAATAYLLRRSRRFGPLGAMASAVVLEQLAASVRGQPAPTPAPASKSSLWTRLAGPKKPVIEPTTT